LNHLRTAIVHEWLVNYAGSERVVESFTNLWQAAEVFCLVDFLNDEQRKIILKNKIAHTSFIQKLPFSSKDHRNYLPLFPKAIERFDLSDFNLIISSSHAVAKGIRKNIEQLHICYCHSPMRYAWDQSEHYMNGLKGSIAKLFISYLKKWDLKSAEGVDYFIANSNHIAGKIKKIYGRDSTVIYPPVDVDKFSIGTSKENFYITASRLVPYKRIDMIAEAFSKMPDKKLIIIGSGPEEKKIKSVSLKNIEILPHQDQSSIKQFMQKARAFVFAADEDFGIVVVEAMACGTPVIAWNGGGTKESVINGKTGILFPKQNIDSIVNSVTEFEKIENNLDSQIIRNHSEKFSRTNFEKSICEFVTEKTALHFHNV